jgi:hypothetical protein
MPCQFSSLWLSHSNFTCLFAALVENYTADPSRFREIQATIQGIVRSPSGHTPQPSMPGSSSNSGNHGHNNYNAGKGTIFTPPPPYQFTGAGHTPQQPIVGYSAPSNGGNSTLSYYKNAQQSMRDLQFKPSPFYSITMRIGDIRTCDGKKPDILLMRFSDGIVNRVLSYGPT